MSDYNNGQYDFQQQTFSLSWLTSLSFNLTGSSSQIARAFKAAMENVLNNDAAKQLIGTWNLVWGPGVFADSFEGTKKRSLNAMFIAAPKEHPEQVVISIAGTNGSSLMSWLVEDFNVSTTVPWPYGTSSLNPEISAGISFGLDKLVNMDARGYLAANPSITEIMVTGHSLGGALSPAYALYLEDTRSEWNPSGSAIIHCLPTAGQTPGDKDFSKYYNKKLLSTTTRVWNSLDIVPHAFNKKTLGKIPTIYEPEIPATESMEILVAALQWIVRDLSYRNILPQTEGFPSKLINLDVLAGKYKPLVDILEHVSKKIQNDLSPVEKDLFGFSDFIIQALLQHTIAYISHFGIDAFAQLMSNISGQAGFVHSSTPDFVNTLKEASSSRSSKSPIVVDLGRQSRKKIKQLKKGEGPLFDDVSDTIECLKADDAVEIDDGVQVVIVVVEQKEKSGSTLGMF